MVDNQKNTDKLTTNTQPVDQPVAQPHRKGRAVAVPVLHKVDKNGTPLQEEIKLTEASSSETKKNDKQRWNRKWLLLIIPALLVLLLLIGYITFVFVPIPIVRAWRNIYIETAMTTGDHQWLATSFIPQYIIDDVMNIKHQPPDMIGGITTEPIDTENETSDPLGTNESVSSDTGETQDPPVDPIEQDILGLADLQVGDKDYAGNTVIVADKEEGLFISEISEKGVLGYTYKGLVMLIDDPSRVFIGTTPEKENRGYRIGEMMDYYGDVIAGVNASGFSDPNEEGRGCDIIGYCMSEGEAWGTYIYGYTSIVLTNDNKLGVGYIGQWEQKGVRDGMQFYPTLIVNSEIMVEGSAGYGLHPRTAVGQREDGVIIMLVIDGRDPLHSVGCTVGDMALIMEKYGAVNAGCCDGGSSCVLAYEGTVLNKNSSMNPTYGRRIPNAFLVRSKKQAADNSEVTSEP